MKSRDYPLMSKKIPLVPKLRFPEFAEEGEWVEKSLGSVGKFVGGGTPSTSESKYWDGNIQWYTPTEVKDGNLKPSLRTITKEGLKDSSAKLLPKGTILVTTRATIGNVAIATQECTTNQGFQSLIVQKSEDNKFWYYWIELHRNEFIRRSSGSTFKEIGKTEIKIIPSLSPAKAEQQKIASCLSSLDQLIVAQKQKLTALKDHKKGLMQNLFPKEGQKVPHYRFPKFEKEGEWVEDNLENRGIFTGGGTPSKNKNDYWKGNFPWVSSSDILEESIHHLNPTRYITKEAIKKSATKIIPANSLLIVSRVGAGKVAVSREEVCTSQDFCSFTPKKDDAIFLGYYLRFNKNALLRFSQGMAIKGFTRREIAILNLSFPKNILEQQKIASCLSALDQVITAQSEKVEQLEQHKKGLMQSLFPKP